MSTIESNVPNNLFVLKHKDLDVAMVAIDLTSGKIEHVLAVYLSKELPVGCSEDSPNSILSWWESRAIPDSRRGIQQAVNEVIATTLHKQSGWKNYVTYEIETTKIEGKEIPCSLNPLFTSTRYEFVSAYQLIKNYKIPNELSSYEAIIEQAVKLGMNENEVRDQLEYTIMTDFILTNVDRHFNNFGFLYDSEVGKLVAMAPIFDTGNSLFYATDIIPQKENLLDIRVNSFCKREADMLRYVKNNKCLNLDKLDGFPDKVQSLLLTYTDMPEKRAVEIKQTVVQKIEYLKLFQQGKKIWKKEKYW